MSSDQRPVSFEEALGLPTPTQEAPASSIPLELSALPSYPPYVEAMLMSWEEGKDYEVRFASTDIAQAARLRLYNAFRFIARRRDELPALYLKTSRIKLKVTKGDHQIGVLTAYSYAPQVWPEALP